MNAVLTKRRFTVEEYHRMAEAGILNEDDRVELLEGEVVKMTPIGSQHAACVARLTKLLTQEEEVGIVWVQNPIRLGESSEPEPDVALLQPREDYYAASHPQAADVLLLIEVADTSAELDRMVKRPLYAQHGIAEVWLIDLTAETVEVHHPPVQGTYQQAQRFERGQTVASSALPQLRLAVDEVLG